MFSILPYDLLHKKIIFLHRIRNFFKKNDLIPGGGIRASEKMMFIIYRPQ